MTTINSVSSIAYTKNIHGNFQSSEVVLYTQDIYKYQILYKNVISKMNSYLIYFARGNYNDLSHNFTNNIQSNLTLQIGQNFDTDKINQLIGFDYDTNTFENVRLSSNHVLDGLKQTLSLVSNNNNLENKNAILQSDSDILNNPTLLKDYIYKRNINVMPFHASETYNTAIEIKPWFLVYLNEIGAPKDGVFETEKLAEIVKRLIEDGTITESDFINS